jgi:DNA-binding transcriptional ArsR family regulator
MEMAQTNNPITTSDRIIRELADIKRLLILQLITSGVEAQHIARALGTSKSTLSRVVSARSLKKIKG